jgi:hypothetical protein
MEHMTLGHLRGLLALMADAPDESEVRIYISQQHRWGQAEEEETYGLVTATLISPPDDEGDLPYLGLRVSDTGGTW